MRKTILSAASAAALTCLIAGTGSAATVTASYTSNPGTSVTLHSATVGGTTSTSASSFTMDPTDGDDFIAFCLDLGQVIAEPVTYAVKSLSETGFGATAINAIDRLFTAHYGSLGTDATNNAAFQLALWEIIDEGDSNAYDVTSGDFSATSSNGAALNLANSFLGNLGSETGGYKITFYESGTSQDLVGASPVPLPAGFALMLTAFGGLSVARRRKAKKA